MGTDPTPSRPFALGAPFDETTNFEAVFEVPSSHRLVAVRSRSRGGPAWGIYWAHEEYDPGGHLVARYESFEELTSQGERRSGWQKFDSFE